MGVAYHQHIVAHRWVSDMSDPVINHASAATRCCGGIGMHLHGDTDQLRFMIGVGRPRGVVQARIRYGSRIIKRCFDEAQVVKLGNMASPKAAVYDIIFQELHGETRIFDLAVGLGHLQVGAGNIDEQLRQGGNNDQAQRQGDE